MRKNKSLAAIESDYSKNKPEIKLIVNRKKAQDLGVGEILLSSVDRDGTKLGYDIELYNLWVESVFINYLV